jgi:hypothetical protein
MADRATLRLPGAFSEHIDHYENGPDGTTEAIIKSSDDGSPIEIHGPIFFRDPVTVVGPGASAREYAAPRTQDFKPGVREDPDLPFSVLSHAPTVSRLVRLGWLTISGTAVKFCRVDFECKIQVTARATLTAVDCSFKTYDGRVE